MNKLNRITPLLSGVEYIAPDVEVLDIAVEAGFAVSDDWNDASIDDEERDLGYY